MAQALELKVSNSDNGVRKSVAVRHCQRCFAITEAEPIHEFAAGKEAYMAAIFDECRQTWLHSLKYHLGYPTHHNMDYAGVSELLQTFPINNLGDPFIKSNYGVNTKQFEVAVLDWFACLWDIQKHDYWGYITNGGTEANFHAFIMGREKFPDGILYTSKDSHFSVFKAARMFRIECIKIDTLISGEIDCVDFKAKLVQNKDKPAIVNVTIGTTFKGAIDDLDHVIKTLEECGFSRDRFYIHCDAALSGLILPFVKQAPQITFKKPIDSACVSGHKMLGCPMPCGVLITRMEHINVLSRNIEYIASRDVTITCSRNGHSSVFLWYILNLKGKSGLQKDTARCLDNASYLKDRLKEGGISCMLNKLSNTVVFECPPDEEFIRKWQLSCQGNIAHVVVMPNVSLDKLHNFIDELLKKRSTWFHDNETHRKPPCVASEIGDENCVCLQHI